MMMQVAIMSHVNRSTRVEEYLRPVLTGQCAQARSLGLSVEGPAVITDDSPPDRRGEGSWNGRRRCLELPGDYVLVVQDDVAVCADFVEAVAALVELRPGEIIALGAKGKHTLRMHSDGRAWKRCPFSEWGTHDGGPCAVFPRWACDMILSYQGARHDDHGVVRALTEDGQDDEAHSFLLAVPALASEVAMESTISGRVRKVPPGTWIGSQSMAPLERFLRQRRT